jgi:uncharacterized protein (TIGR00375 family)
MKLISDLHIHSKYSRSCGKELNLANLEKWAKIKGVDLLGTGDFTHPKWIEELKSGLTEDGSGVLKSKSGYPFILQTEISLMYSQGGKGRRVHNVVLAPDFDTVDQITEELLKRGRIDYDGRPIFKIPCNEFVEMLRGINNRIEVIPAHIWTPHFAMFGSKSGFNSVKECFGSQAKHINAIETGLSSDPAMNYRVSQLDDKAIVSFSDLHSYWPWRLGREATVFDIDLTYDSLINALKTREGIVETYEVDPNYGKYHFDGHRKCDVIMPPHLTKKFKGICPVCKKNMIIGVMNRIEDLADRESSFENKKPKSLKPFRYLMPLHEILSAHLKKGIATKTVWNEYNQITKPFKNEFDVLLNVKKEQLLKVTTPQIAELIMRNRAGNVYVYPGFDGNYGRPVFDEKEIEKLKEEINREEYRAKSQTGLNDF